MGIEVATRVEDIIGIKSWTRETRMPNINTKYNPDSVDLTAYLESLEVLSLSGRGEKISTQSSSKQSSDWDDNCSTWEFRPLYLNACVEL